LREAREERVTERVDHLSASEERYHTLVTMSPDGISVVDQTGKIIDCNEQFALMHGYDSRAEMLGRFAAEFVQPEQFERLYQRIGSALMRGENVVRGVRVDALRRDGSVCITEYSVASVPWPEAPAGTAYLSSIRDITPQKEVQERAAGLEEAVVERTRELQTERDRTQAILETLGESVVVVDNDGIVLFANPATAALSGYPRDEILGQPLWNRWCAETLAKAWPEAQHAVEAGQARPIRQG
jgi:PAS domain S-box-containing protein